MSHLYFNTTVDNEINEIFSDTKSSDSISIDGNTIAIFYDDDLWKQQKPIVKENDRILLISGWFINSNYELNNINGMFDELKYRSIKEIVDDLIGGIFIAVYYSSGNFSIFCDPFGLTPHFYSMNDDIKISPSATDCTTNGHVNLDLSRFLEQQGHLFSKYTKYENVYKFIPGDLLELNVRKSNKINYKNNGFKIDCKEFNVADITVLAKKIVNSFSQSDISVALSAGFDSRLIFMESDAPYTYTWGQESSLDVINGKKLASMKGSKHTSFGFREHKISSKTEYICKYIFDGSVINYNPQFMENYKFVYKQSIEQNIALDGYLGDVLQRGVYMTHGGKIGEIYKLFPSLTVLFLDSKTLVNNRYSKVDQGLRNLVISEFESKTSNVEGIDELHKVTYFEFLYGRGLRYITTASIGMNGLFKTIVPVFATRYIFSVLVSQRARKTLNYTVFNKIWENTPQGERNMNSEGMYSPSTPRIFIPYYNLIGRLVTNFFPKYMNYTKK